MGARTGLVLVATGHPRPATLQQSLAGTTVLGHALRQALATEWPLVVVTSEALAGPLARWVATRDIVSLGADDLSRGAGRAAAVGVAALADADGWVVLPAERPLVQPATLRAVGQALAEHPVAYAQHLGRPGEPAGFAAELFSDLIRADGADGLRRVAVRYPSLGVEVDDPGVLIDVAAAAGLAQARAALVDG